MNLYYIALVIVTMGALLNRSAFPYAAVLCLVWAAFAALEHSGLSSVYPWVDCASIYPLTYMAFRRPKWWNVAIVVLCFVTVLSHLVFWTAYYANVYLGEEYKNALRALFLLSMAIALIGNTDVKRLVGLAVKRLLGLLRGRSAFGFAGGQPAPYGAKESLGDRDWSRDLRGIQRNQYRMGDWKADSPHRTEKGDHQFGNRGSDGGTDSRLHLSETGF